MLSELETRLLGVMMMVIMLGMGARYIDGVFFNVFAVFSIAYLTQLAPVKVSREVALWAVSASALVVMSVIGGIMVPKIVMPEAMQTASWFVPQGWALEGYLDLLVRGRGAADVLPHAGVLLAFAAAAFAAAGVRMARMRREG